MAEDAHNWMIATTIRAIASHTETDRNRLAAAMARSCWPGGAGDRSEPVALEWVRRGGPRVTVPLAPACSCAAGRCGVCN